MPGKHKTVPYTLPFKLLNQLFRRGYTPICGTVSTAFWLLADKKLIAGPNGNRKSSGMDFTMDKAHSVSCDEWEEKVSEANRIEMKTLFRIFALILLTGVMVSLSSCSTDRDRNDANDNQVTTEDFDRERNELRDELRELRNDIDRELEKVDTRLDRAAKDKNDDADRVELEKANRDLTQERTRIDKTLEDIENASEETWADVKVAARNTSQEVKAAFQEMGNELEALFEDKETQE